jgi:hypothetical protein
MPAHLSGESGFYIVVLIVAAITQWRIYSQTLSENVPNQFLESLAT